MPDTKVYYEISTESLDETITRIKTELGLEPMIVEDYMTIIGKEESGIETIRMSIEESIVKVMVVLTKKNLLEECNGIFGTPTKIKGPR